MRLQACAALLLVLAAAMPSLAGLCDKCACYPSAQQPVTVYCNCQGAFQKLVMSPGDMKDLATVKKFTVSFCQSVEFLTNSFAEVHSLSALSLQQVGNASIAMGVFSSLRALVVEDVTSLRLARRAFMGVDALSNIVIRRARLPELPAHALYGLRGLNSLELESVTVGALRSHAVQLNMAHGSSVLIDDCQLESVEEDALVVLATNEFKLSNSELLAVARNGINITSEGSVQLTGNHLGTDVSAEAVSIAAWTLDVSGNTFQRLPREFMSRLRVKPGPFSFSNNSVLQADLNLSDLGSLFNSDASGNHLPCPCSQGAKVSLLNFTPTRALLERNYCMAPCNVSLLNFPQRCSSSSPDDDITGKALCDEPEPETTIATVTRRPGRALDTPTSTTRAPAVTRRVSPPHFVTPAPQSGAATQSIALVSSTAAILTAVLLR